MRHWIFTKQALECPWCQNLTPQTQYCSECKKWDNHIAATEDCPLMQQELIFDYLNNEELLDEILYSISRTKKKSKQQNNKGFPI
jgi:hypothetical protein